MKIEFVDGKLSVWDDKGKLVVGVVQATVFLQEDGRREALLYVNLDHVRMDDLQRHVDGVRDGGTRDARPEPE